MPTKCATWTTNETPLQDHPRAQDVHGALLDMNTSSSADTAESERSWKQRVRAFFVEYGAVGLAVHTLLSLAILAIVFACVSNGVDVSEILASVGVADNAKGSTAHSAGSFFIAFAIFKLLAPLRVPMTLAVTPFVMRALRRRGLMLPPAASSLDVQQSSPLSRGCNRSDATAATSEIV